MARIRLETVIRAPPERVFDLARDVDFHARSMAHTRERAVGGRTSGLIELGEEVEWEARHFGLTLRLRSRITAMDRPRSFVDEQARGTFRSFVHRHEFTPHDGGTKMLDDWNHEAPLGFLADPLFLARYMRKLLVMRNALLKREAESQFGG